MRSLYFLLLFLSNIASASFVSPSNHLPTSDVFNVDSSGNVYTAGAIRTGTPTALLSTLEMFSDLLTLTSIPPSAQNAAGIQVNLNTNSVNNRVIRALNSQSLRTITSSVTDTQVIGAANFSTSFNVASGQTYTNSASPGASAINIGATSLSGGGTLALAAYAGISFSADSTATGTTKIFLNFNTLSGGTNNSYIADNRTFVGNYFINSTSSNPSLLSGVLSLPATTTGTNADFLCLSSTGVVLLQSSACTISSKRFKENITPLTKADGLTQILKMKPVSFNMKDTHNKDHNYAKRQTGMLAEDLAAIDTRLAVYEDDEKTPKSYRQEAVIALLVKGMQQQQMQINELKRLNKKR